MGAVIFTQVRDKKVGRLWLASKVKIWLMPIMYFFLMSSKQFIKLMTVSELFIQKGSKNKINMN